MLVHLPNTAPTLFRKTIVACCSTPVVLVLTACCANFWLISLWCPLACLSSPLRFSKIGMEDLICVPGRRIPGMDNPGSVGVKTESVGVQPGLVVLTVETIICLVLAVWFVPTQREGGLACIVLLTLSSESIFHLWSLPIIFSVEIASPATTGVGRVYSVDQYGLGGEAGILKMWRKQQQTQQQQQQ